MMCDRESFPFDFKELRLFRWLAALGLAMALATPPRAGEAADDYTAIAIDATNGNILYQRYPDKTMYPASLTKMMTLYMIFEALEAGEIALDTTFRVSARAQARRPSKLGLLEGQSISVEDSIMALMTKSANDVATVVAEGLGRGSEWRFAIAMTERARELGMRNTTFTNASGWHDSDMISTARDMAVLSLRLQSDFPQYYRLFAATRWTYKGKTYKNHNKLLGSVAGVDGLKTGYTNPAGWNLAASALVDGRRVVAVVMGGKTRVWRDRRMKKLIAGAFETAAERDRAAPIPGEHPRRSENAIVLASVGTGALDPGRAAPIPGEHPRRGENAIVLTSVETDASDPLAAAVAALGSGEERLAEQQGSAEDLPWAVQIGAFSGIEGAYRALDGAEVHLGAIVGGDATTIVTTTGNEDSVLYRARIVNLTETQARKGCEELHRRDLPCAVVRHASGG